MNNNLDIPKNPEDVTPEWLTQALRITGTIRKTQVRSLQIKMMDAGAGFVAQLARIKLEYMEPEYKLSSSFLALGHQFGPNLIKVFNEFSSKPVTLLHKDTHVDNLFFNTDDKNPSVTFLDWQLAGWGRSLCDVSYFIVYSVPVEIRRQGEQAFIQIYHDVLTQNGVSGYSYEKCWEDYQRGFFRNMYMLSIVTHVLDFSRPYGRKIFQTFLSRTIAFSEDHAVERFL